MKFLVAVDGSKAADSAFKKARELAKSSDEVIVLFVSDKTHYLLSQPLSLLTAEGFPTDENVNNQANIVIDKYRTLVSNDEISGINFNFKIQKGDPKEVIQNLVEEESVDILLLGQVGLTSGKNAMLGSTSEYCMRNCKCDVLVCKSGLSS